MSHQLWTTCIRHKVRPDLLYFLDCCRSKIQPDKIVPVFDLRAEAVEMGLMDESNNLTYRGLSILEEFETLLVKNKKKTAADVLGINFMDKIAEYREMFPARRFPSGELARQSVQELKDKFVWFFKTFPEYNWKDVLDATDYYLYVKSKSNFDYAATSSYFIHKSDTRTKTWKSLLADHCQMIADNPELLAHP